MTTLSVVIPAYNEEDGIAEIAHRVLAVKDSLREVGVDDLELIVVDDGSKDKTIEIASNIDGVTLIKHPKNKGYGGALKTGFSQAKGELIGFLDADGTYPPEYFPKLCVEAMNGSEIVVGSRMAGAKTEMPAMRRIGNFFFANLLSILGRQRITDSASGMRVFKKEILQKILPLPDGLNLTPVMSTRALHEQIKMTEIPIPYSERLGDSKLSVVHDGRLFLESMIWTALTYNPVRILGLIGLTGIIISILVSIGLVIARIGDTTSLGAWGVTAVFTALITAVGGISIFALGVTFNYMVSIFHKQPIRQGLFKKPIFKTPINHQFGWMGLLALVLGFVLGAGILSLAISQSWPIQRVWLYLLGSAMATLVGIQLIIYWILTRVLEQLSQREILAKRDLQGYGQ
ncbi:D-glycero-beta-D-manno-heptose-1,7-bisphosphate 7-phosphatase [hydrothermal vent metagenome]|uniref:D-glycero-beta-D-manno-heptose-1,7-bisphosphate 7-phosphatase n=1 Tax=hydrothermal vent metagenome TaxID=652676 RepID=A0A3B0V0M7_9ZZZZ